MNILVVSYNSFPEGDAGSLRQYTFGKLFSCLGHTVFFIGMGDNIDCYEIGDYKAFRYTTLRINQNKAGFIHRIGNYYGYKLRLQYFIKQYSLNNKIDCILVVDIPINALLYVKSLARKYNISLMHDSVEWYSPEQFKLGKFAPSYILKDLYNRSFIDSKFKVVAISKFLEKHFLKRRIKTIRIPAILDVNDISCKKRSRKGILTILYAGSPGKKDYLKELIEGIALLNKNIIDTIDLKLIGINMKQLIDICAVSPQAINKLGNSLTALGRIPRDDVLKHLEEADFTILLRSETQRYAKAGFPTKVVESLASATPVITNLTSDLGDYLSDGYNSIIINGCTKGAVTEALGKAISMAPEAKVRMQKNARETALRNFDYKSYIQVMKRLLIGDKIDDTK